MLTLLITASVTMEDFGAPETDPTESCWQTVIMSQRGHVHETCVDSSGHLRTRSYLIEDDVLPSTVPTFLPIPQTPRRGKSCVSRELQVDPPVIDTICVHPSGRAVHTRHRGNKRVSRSVWQVEDHVDAAALPFQHSDIH